MNMQHLLNRIEVLEKQMKTVLGENKTVQIGLTSSQIEAKYGISRSTRYRWIYSGKLKKIAKYGLETIYEDPNFPIKKKNME